MAFQFSICVFLFLFQSLFENKFETDDPDLNIFLVFFNYFELFKLAKEKKFDFHSSLILVKDN